MDRITTAAACLILCCLAGCTAVNIAKHTDGSADIRAVSLFQDIQIPVMKFAATRPSDTTQPATEDFEMNGYGQQARTELLMKMLDKLPPVP